MQLAGVFAAGIRPLQDGDCHPYAEPFRHTHDHTWLGLTRGRAGAIWLWPGGKCRRAGLQGRMVLPCRGISGQSLPHTCTGSLLEIAALQQSYESFVDMVAFRLFYSIFSFSWDNRRTKLHCLHVNFLACRKCIAQKLEPSHHALAAGLLHADVQPVGE